MKKSQILEMPQFFDRYINLVDDIELMEGLQTTVSLFEAMVDLLEKNQEKRYAPGKWTPKEVLQHIIDTERIMAYRALRISRKDPTELPGFDEAIFVANANIESRSIKDLLEEFNLVRMSNIALFRNMNDEMLSVKGISNKVSICALSLGFVIIGHPIHHLNILKERYF